MGHLRTKNLVSLLRALTWLFGMHASSCRRLARLLRYSSRKKTGKKASTKPAIITKNQ